MSVNNLIKTESDQVPEWSNLYVNSLRSRNGIIIDKDEGNYNVYLNTDSGNDANNGLTSSTPVLTLEKAIELLSRHSAETGIINCDGAARIIPNNNVDGFGNAIDLSLLEGRYSEIQLKGTPIINVPEFTYAGTNATWGPSPVIYRQLDNLTLAVNPKFCHKISSTKEEYAPLASNTIAVGTATANLVGGTDIGTGNKIEFISLSGQELFVPSRTTIVGEIRFVIKELAINNDGNNHSIVCNENTYFKGCSFDGIDVLKGEATLQGCTSDPGVGSKPFTSVKLDIDGFFHAGDKLTFSDVGGLVEIRNFYTVGSTGYLELTYNTDCYISNSVFNNFAIYLTKKSSLSAVNLHFSGAYTTYTPVFINNSKAYLDVVEFTCTSDDVMVDVFHNGSLTFDGTLTSTQGGKFAEIDTMSELNILDAFNTNLNSSSATTVIDLKGRSKLLIVGPAGTMSSTANCILLQNGSSAYISSITWTNSGAGAGFIKVGTLAAQAGGPLTDEFDYSFVDGSGDFSVLNV